MSVFARLFLLLEKHMLFATLPWGIEPKIGTRGSGAIPATPNQPRRTGAAPLLRPTAERGAPCISGCSKCVAPRSGHRGWGRGAWRVAEARVRTGHGLEGAPDPIAGLQRGWPGCAWEGH